MKLKNKLFTILIIVIVLIFGFTTFKFIHIKTYS